MHDKCFESKFYLNIIKKLIEEKEVNNKVKYLESNKETIKTYYEIGRLLIKAQGGEGKAKYSDGLIKKWSEKLTKEFGKGYDISNMKKMKKLYLVFQKGGSLCHLFNLSWTHWRYLLPLKNENEYSKNLNSKIKMVNT